jgi:hypothetical protein
VVQAFLRANLEMDARPILPLIQAPTLVLHRRDDQFIPVANGRCLAERISGARVVELDGTEQSLFWETPEAVLDHIGRFLTGMRRGVQPTQTLATVLFTDIVSSTERAEELGDRRWRELLNVHDELTGRNQRLHPLGAGAGAACDQPMAPPAEPARLRSRGCDRTDWSGGVGHDWLSCSTPPGL